MKSTLALILLAISMVSCTRTENGLVFGTPDYEKRNIAVAETDLTILLKTKELLSDETHWRKNGSRTCHGSPPYNLYCALESASLSIDGKYLHRRPALQEVRFTIDDNFRNRWKVHRLADFNSHTLTTHNDIVDVLDRTIQRVKVKLASKK